MLVTLKYGIWDYHNWGRRKIKFAPPSFWSLAFCGEYCVNRKQQIEASRSPRLTVSSTRRVSLRFVAAHNTKREEPPPRLENVSSSWRVSPRFAAGLNTKREEPPPRLGNVSSSWRVSPRFAAGSQNRNESNQLSNDARFSSKLKLAT